MNNDTVRAARATIKLGGIPLDVFQLPNGEYRLSQSQVLETIDAPNNWITRLPHSEGTERVKYLQGKGFTGLQQKIEFKEEGARGTKSAKTLSIPDAVLVWRWFDKQGNNKAEAIIDACAIESIERRADSAFGVQRDEADYQAKMKARIDGKVVRQSLTDAIKDYILRHPELSSNDKKWLYKNCSDKTNKIILGKIAKKAAEELGCEHAQLRDYLQAEQLIRISYLEDVTVKLIHLQDIHPLQAVIQAANRLLLDFEE
jgi:hypothetical protein